MMRGFMGLQVPQTLADELFVRNDRTCCICRDVRHYPLQLHHINGDPTNHARSNLAVVCANCHAIVSITGGMGRRYTPSEVRRFKEEWEAEVARGRNGDEDDSEDDSVEPDLAAKILVRAGFHEVVPIPIDAPSGVLVKLESNVPVNVFVAEDRDVRRYERGADFDVLADQNDLLEGTIEAVVPRVAAVSLVIENEDESDATVEYAVAVCEA